jgi:hypothetical protein
MNASTLEAAVSDIVARLEQSCHLPAKHGSYEDRRIYKLDLFERQLVEAAGIQCR